MPEKEINEPIVPTHEFPEEDDMQAFRDNPRNACEWMQRKYIGMTFDEYQEYRATIKDYEWEVWPHQELIDQEYTNVYTKEVKVVKVLHDIPQEDPAERIKKRIEELRIKLIEWTITDAEREELKLLIW